MNNILYLVTEDWYFWSHRKILAERTLKEGYKVIVVTNPGSYADKMTAIGIEVVPITMARSIASPIKEINSVLKLIEIHKKYKPDLVHNISLKPILLGSIAAWIAGVPRVINAYTGLGYLFISSSWSSSIFKKVVTPFLSLLFKREQFYSIVQNKDDEALLMEQGLVKTEKYSLISGAGVDTSHFKYTPEEPTDTPIVMFASRLLVDKGVREFIEACKILRTRNIGANYVVVGDVDEGNPSSINKSELNSWLEDQVVEWWGHRDDMYNVICSANVVCLPSYREGLPKILLEAASVGRAIVTTDVPGCRNIVTNNINGLIVNAKDAISLADAMESLVCSPAVRIEMGKAGRTLVENKFDVNIINRKTIDLYNLMLNK